MTGLSPPKWVQAQQLAFKTRLLQLAEEWDARADAANVEMAAGAIHGCASELRELLDSETSHPTGE